MQNWFLRGLSPCGVVVQVCSQRFVRVQCFRPLAGCSDGKCTNGYEDRFAVPLRGVYCFFPRWSKELLMRFRRPLAGCGLFRHKCILSIEHIAFVLCHYTKQYSTAYGNLQGSALFLQMMPVRTGRFRPAFASGFVVTGSPSADGRRTRRCSAASSKPGRRSGSQPRSEPAPADG